MSAREGAWDDDPKYRKGKSDGRTEERSAMAQRAAATRKAKAAQTAAPPIEIDVVTGEILAPAVAGTSVRLRNGEFVPPDIARAMLPEPCSANFAQVCRRELDNYTMELIRRHDLHPSAQLIIVRSQIWADPWTGQIDRNQTEMAASLNMTRPTFHRHLKTLVNIEVMIANTRAGARDSSVAFVDLELLVRLATEHRASLAGRRLESRLIERITERETTRERITERFVP